MVLKVYRIYELEEYSFLAVFQVEASVNEVVDTNIFVCQDDVLCKQQPNCAQGTPIGRYVLCGTTPSPLTLNTPPPSYPTPDFTIYPNRVLETIASDTDMLIHPTSPPADNPYSFYRASTVAMIFNSSDMMNKTINMIEQDFRIHARIMSLKTADTELKSYTDMTDDDLRNYFYQG